MENGKLPTTSSPMKREPSGRGAAGGRRDSATERRPTEFFRQSRHHLGFAGEVGCSRWRRSGERFVDSLGQRSSSGLYEPNYDPDDGLSNTDSCDESIASSDEECASKKKKALEDALFGFFRKEAIKSLKRDFSKFCMNFDLKTEISVYNLISKYGYLSLCLKVFFAWIIRLWLALFAVCQVDLVPLLILLQICSVLCWIAAVQGVLQYVPCSVRVHLARYIEHCRAVAIRRGDKDAELALHSSEGDLYCVLFSHGRVSSKFHGPSREQLVADYGLRHRDIMTVRLEYYGTLIGIDFYRGGDMLSPLPCVALEDLSDSEREIVGSCFYSRGVNLNYQQFYFMSRHLFEDNYILCCPFVHRISSMNVNGHHMVWRFNS